MKLPTEKAHDPFSDQVDRGSLSLLPWPLTGVEADPAVTSPVAHDVNLSAVAPAPCLCVSLSDDCGLTL